MEKRLLLNNWTFKSPNESWLPAKVPGCIHLDLLNHSIIEDPFYGTNEKQLQWIDKRDWDYETRFDVKEEVFNLSNLELQFAGLDTYTDVYLNNKRILSTDNMFRIWTVDVKKYIKLTDNLLSVHFRSPINEDLPKLKKLGYQLPATNDDSKLGELGDQKISIFARKAPYHYGWDWGPRFVTSGIWRDVHLRGWSEARITDLFIEQTSVTTERAQVKAMIEVETDCDMEAIIKIAAEELQFEKKVALTGGVNSVELELEIESPKLWWCQGLGDPSMYTFKAELLIENEVLSTKNHKNRVETSKVS
ncbi:MAG: hypothetical protein LRY71_05220 [Bacillaceae bacterium]|nr:hypothetical protein [Bacillaceae bacterium]